VGYNSRAGMIQLSAISPSAPQRQCKTCAYAQEAGTDRHGDQFFECRYNPPVMEMTATGYINTHMTGNGVWPKVRWNHWCGRYGLRTE
jgi:hypothetical protein